jgi:hypothetical protein
MLMLKIYTPPTQVIIIKFKWLCLDKLDLINNLNSIKLLAISEAFEKFPNEQVDLDQFVKIMKEVLEDTKLTTRDEFISDLVDLFYRANKT